MDLPGFRIEYISTVTCDVRGAAVNIDAEMVLCDQVNGEMILKYFNIRMIFYFAQQCPLNLGPGLVFMMKYPELGVTAFLVQIKPSRRLLIEFNSPFNQFPDPFR